MDRNSYSLANIHLPEDRKLTRRLVIASRCVSFIIVILSLKIIFLDVIEKDTVLLEGLGYLVTAVVLAVGGGRGYQFLQEKTSVVDKVRGVISPLGGASVIFLGAAFLYQASLLRTTTLLPLFILGIVFILFGISLLLPLLRLIHRFHLVHICTLVVLSLGTITLLGFLYRQISFHSSDSINLPLQSAIMIFLTAVCFSLRWPARGFISLFTTDSTSGTFAIRMLFFSIFTISCIGFIIQLGVLWGFYTIYEAIAIGSVSLMITFTALTWINTKLLYRMELERFFMREELRVHNIDLELGNDELAKRMVELERSNKEISNKLDFRNKYYETLEGKD